VTRRTGLLITTALAVCLATVAVACAPVQRVASQLPAPTSPAGSTPVMAPARVTAQQIAAWVASKRITDARPPVPVAELAQYYIEEGAAEGVAGELAFIQAIIETGWFRFSTRVPPEFNNFSGMGAVDGGTTANRYPTPRIGVRAQIQHLRAYADPTVTVASLANPLVSTRWYLVNPRGMAPTWEQFGNGVWASDPGYAKLVLSLYSQLLTHAGVPR
jgi:hypothetical protein